MEQDRDNEHSSDSDVVITKVERAKTSRVKKERPSTRLNDRDTNIWEGDDSKDEAVFRDNPFKKRVQIELNFTNFHVTKLNLDWLDTI